jgi:ATP-dependent Clp protease adaptor protein ClpS
LFGRRRDPISQGLIAVDPNHLALRINCLNPLYLDDSRDDSREDTSASSLLERIAPGAAVQPGFTLERRELCYNWRDARWRAICVGDMTDKRKIGRPGDDTGILTKTRPQTKKPSMYKVLLLNDDYTPMEFVIVVLMRIFGMAQENAAEVMMHVHRRGVGICGVYPFEVAETKVTQVVDFARRNEHPLQCTMEKD